MENMGPTALGRKLLASSTFKRTGSGGIWLITPSIEFIWFRMLRMLSWKRTSSSVFSLTCSARIRCCCAEPSIIAALTAVHAHSCRQTGCRPAAAIEVSRYGCLCTRVMNRTSEVRAAKAVDAPTMLLPIQAACHVAANSPQNEHGLAATGLFAATLKVSPCRRPCSVCTEKEWPGSAQGAETQVRPHPPAHKRVLLGAAAQPQDDIFK